VVGSQGSGAHGGAGDGAGDGVGAGGDPTLGPAGGAGTISVLSDVPRGGGASSYVVNARFDRAVANHEGACALQTIGSCSFDPCTRTATDQPSGPLGARWPNPGVIDVSAGITLATMLAPSADGSYEPVTGSTEAWEGSQLISFVWGASPPDWDAYVSADQAVAAPAYATIVDNPSFSMPVTVSPLDTVLRTGGDVTITWKMDGVPAVADRIVFTFDADAGDPTSFGREMACEFEASALMGVISSDLLALMPHGPTRFDMRSSHRLQVVQALWTIDYVLSSHVRSGSSGLVTGSLTLE
jgi:hypothetical protein